MSVFGPMVDGEDVEIAVTNHLKAWLPDYIAEVERIKDLEPASMPMIRGWETTPEIRKWPETQLPAVIVVSTGIEGKPELQGDGSLAAWFAVQAIAIASANTEDNSTKLAKRYVAAIRGAMLQHPSIDGLADGSRFVTEGYGPLPDKDEDRTFAAAGGAFEIRVPNLMNTRAGLRTPSEDPYEVTEWPTVDETDLEVEKQ